MATRHHNSVLIVLLVAFLMLGTPSFVVADSPKRTTSLAQVRAEYQRLSATDSQVENLLAWERSGARLEEQLKLTRSDDEKAELLFQLGELFERTYRARSFQPGLAKATYFYEVLARDHRGHKLVPDALLRLGDLRREGLKDPVAARAAYFEVIDIYGASEFAAKAKERLAAVDAAPEGNEEAAEADAKLSGFSIFGGGRDELGGRDIIGGTVEPAPRPVVVIDAGHGGEELGAVGVDGVLEKQVTLEIALLLDELLKERLRAKTVLTRSTDVSLPLAERTKIANESKGDLFISIHANASEYKTAKGIETYYLDNTNDKASLKLAERENASLQKSGDDLGFIISDFIQNAKLGESISLAHHVQDTLTATLARYYEGVKGLGVKKAPFYVLVGAHMPCVLVEVSFIDHPVEGKRLASRRYQKLIASAIYQAVKAYFVATAKGGKP